MVKKNKLADIDLGGGILVGENRPPVIVAEMSGNHNRSLDRALALIDAAAHAGAHALKIQTYTADTMTIDFDGPGFVIRDPKSLWDGRKLYELYQEAATPWEWHDPIIKRCRELGLLCFSTPFDESSVDFLESLNVTCYKIASFENTDIPLLKRVAQTKKPVIVSTGMASREELTETVKTLRDHGCRDLILLKCTSTYPASPVHSNLYSIPHMRDVFDCHIGLSDHTMGIAVPVASVSLGAVLIEKHFTLKRADGGVDSSFSLEPDELTLLVQETQKAWQALGAVSYGATEVEKSSLAFRRSLYVVRDMQPGDIFTSENIRAIRPGFGLPPRFLDRVLGKKSKIAIRRGSPLSQELII